jgi:hypothetical protein
VAGTLASYVLGDSVTQFSTVIGVYLSALGLGSWLSSWVQRGLARRFVEIELTVALLGGASAPLLFLAFGYLPDFFRPVLYGVVVVVGTLVGLLPGLGPLATISILLPLTYSIPTGGGQHVESRRLPTSIRRMSGIGESRRGLP